MLMINKSSQSGFGHLALLLIIILIAGVGGAGYYVWSQNNEPEQPVAQSSTSSDTVSNESNQKASNIFTDKGGLYSITLPDQWGATYDNEKNPTDYSRLALKPNDYQAPGNEVNRVVGIYDMQYPIEYIGETFNSFDEFKKSQIMGYGDMIGENTEMTINGYPVWKVSQIVKDSSPTGPPELSGGYEDIHYYFHKDNARIIHISMRTYQRATINYLGNKISESFDNTKYKTDFEAIVNSLKLN